MRGCLAVPFRLAGVLLLGVVLYFGWLERDRIASFWHRMADRPTPGAEGATGRPTDASLGSAREKIDSLNGWRADSVVLTASEMASLVAAGLDSLVRSDLDSLVVTLGVERIAVAGQIRTAGLPRDMLGPVAGALDAWEPVRGAGPVEVIGVGRAAWRVDAFQVRDFDFPREMVPRIVGQVAGKPSDSVLGIVIPAGIGRVRVHPEGVTLYPSGRQP